MINGQRAERRLVLLKRFAELTGYTVKACQRKIEDGVWTEGIHYFRAPDGRVTIDLNQYEIWVTGK